MTESDKQQVELAGCPFCEESENVNVHGAQHWNVFCHRCSAEGPFTHSFNEAITAWNTRHSPDREKIREALTLLGKCRMGVHDDICSHCGEIGCEPGCELGRALTLLKEVLEKEK